MKCYNDGEWHSNMTKRIFMRTPFPVQNALDQNELDKAREDLTNKHMMYIAQLPDLEEPTDSPQFQLAKQTEKEFQVALVIFKEYVEKAKAKKLAKLEDINLIIAIETLNKLNNKKVKLEPISKSKSSFFHRNFSETIMNLSSSFKSVFRYRKE